MSRILVVDDDPISLDLLSNALGKAGYDVSTATDGWQACRILEREQFDALITDEIMSAMNGLELCRFARELGLELPIILITSLDEQLFQTELRDEFGIVAVLAKPIVPPLLLYILDASLQTLAAGQ
jgi:CheY-like chemotaxis protein